MRRFLVGALVFLMCAPLAGASFIAVDEDGAQLGHAQRLKGKLAYDGVSALNQGEVCMPVSISDAIAIGGAVPTQISGLTTTPEMIVDNNVVALYWADNQTSKAQLRFRVMDGFVGSPVIRILTGRRAYGGNLHVWPPALDFEVFVDDDVTAFDTAATNQTAVRIDTVGQGSPKELELTVDTDFDTLAEGQWVTLNIWRDNTAAPNSTTTDGLLVYGIEFCGNTWQ